VNHRLLTRITQSGTSRALLAGMNRLPLSFSRGGVRVHGARMTAHSADRAIALLLWKFGLLERHEFRYFLGCVRPGMRIADIGANIGLYTLPCAMAAGVDGRVWAFEPEERNHRTLARNITLNNLTNVTLEQAAAGDRNRDAVLYTSASNSGDHSLYTNAGRLEGTACRVIVLDDYFPSSQRLDLVKIDVQGGEGAVLRGMQRLLRNNPAMEIVMEFWPEGIGLSGIAPEDLLASLLRDGWVLSRITPNGAIPWAGTPAQLVRYAGEQEYLNLSVRGPAWRGREEAAA
jgi:FkbM family methyltransferase